MKLLKLRANKESFHTIFKSKGISLIVAKKRTENERNTYNSVGILINCFNTFLSCLK